MFHVYAITLYLAIGLTSFGFYDELTNDAHIFLDTVLWQVRWLVSIGNFIAQKLND
jgi:hypothetical protein